jgi:hypothetical protein
MAVSQNTAPQLGGLSYTITGGTATAAGGQGAIQNPEGVPLIIKDWKLYVVSNSTGATNLTIGTAASGTVAANSLLTTTAMAAAAGSVFGGIVGGTAAGQNLTTTVSWGSADYINITASASAAGLSAILFINYYRTA